MRMAVSTPEVGLDQQVLQLLQRISVELPLGEDAGDVFGQFGRGLGQAGLEALEPARFSRRLGGGGGVTPAAAAAAVHGGCGAAAASAGSGAAAPARGRTAKAAEEATGFCGLVAHGAHVGASSSPCNRRPVGPSDAGAHQRARCGAASASSISAKPGVRPSRVALHQQLHLAADLAPADSRPAPRAPSPAAGPRAP